MPILSAARIGLASVLLAHPALAGTVVPVFSPGNFQPGARIDNPYFPLVPGTRRTFVATGAEPDGTPTGERDTLLVAGPGPRIAGVETATVVDRAYEEGLLVEETFDFYAQDVLGNVWYMGEDVTKYRYDDHGDLIGTDSESSWRAGVNGALPGYAMPVGPEVGFAYFQEYAAADEALDEGRIHGFLDLVEIGGQTFEDVLMVFETSTLDPDLREIKYYAPGFGLIRAEEGVDDRFSNPALTFTLIAPVPVPASLPLALTAIGVSAILVRRRTLNDRAADPAG